MSRVVTADLYERLPAHLRTADAEAGGALWAVLDIIAAEADRIGAQIDSLFDTPFIETCPDWAVPYIADLLGVELTSDIAAHSTPDVLSQRARVANTVRYRRRKGTASVLESLAFDVAGWRTVAIEQFERLALTQSMLHPRVELPATVDLRDGSNLEATPGPFGAYAKTIDVRNVRLDDPVVGDRPNLANVILHAYQLDALVVPAATAQPGPAPGQYLVDLLGRDEALFNPPEADRGVEVRTTEDEVPARLRRRRLREELDARRTAVAAGNDDPAPRWRNRAPFELFIVPSPGDEPVAIDALLIESCHLDPWKDPSPTGKVRVDPVLGRVVFPDPQPHRLLTSAAIGLIPGVGAGPFHRPGAERDLEQRNVVWQRGVSRDLNPVPGEIVNSLTDAVAEWNAAPAGTVGVICVLDNHRYSVDFTGADHLQIPEGSHLTIIAAGWPELPVVGGVPNQVARRLGTVVAAGLRPAISGTIEVRGFAPAASLIAGELTIDGFLFDGHLRVTGGAGRQLGRLRLRSVTQVGGRVRASGNRRSLSVDIIGSQIGPIALSDTVSDLNIEATVVAGDVDAPGALARFDHVTVLGRATLRQAEANNSLFAQRLVCRLRQEGCVRYCFVPVMSRTPRQYRCISAPPPTFVSTDRADPALGVLDVNAGKAVWSGSEYGDQVGAYGIVRPRQRLRNLEIALTEYLRIGTEVGILRNFSNY